MNNLHNVAPTYKNATDMPVIAWDTAEMMLRSKTYSLALIFRLLAQLKRLGSILARARGGTNVTNHFTSETDSARRDAKSKHDLNWDVAYFMHRWMKADSSDAFSHVTQFVVTLPSAGASNDLLWLIKYRLNVSIA